MTKNEALVISAYTGVMCVSNFSDLHGYIEKVMGRPVFTHEIGGEQFLEELKEKVKPELLEIIKGIK